MANKRDLKKRVRYICGDLAAECVMARQLVPGVDKDKMRDIVEKIAGLQENTLKRMSFSFDKSERSFDNRHTFIVAKTEYFHKAFNKLVSEFNDTVEEIVKEMNAALPQAAKDANKAAVNA